MRSVTPPPLIGHSSLLCGDIYFVDQEKLLPTYLSSKLLIVDLLAEPKYCQMIFQTDVWLITITWLGKPSKLKTETHNKHTKHFSILGEVGLTLRSFHFLHFIALLYRIPYICQCQNTFVRKKTSLSQNPFHGPKIPIIHKNS